MGSIFQPKVSTPPVPPSPPPASYRDEIGGTERIPVLNDDGTYTYITRQIPLTAEQQAEHDEYQKIMQEALGEIQKLSATDYEEDASTLKILNAWEEESQIALSRSFNEREEEENKILARRGLSTSSAGEAATRRRLEDKQDANSQLQRERDLLSDDIRSEQLSLQQNLYNIASNKQDLNSAKALSSATSGMSAVAGINAGNRASIADYYSRQLSAQNSRLQNTGLFGNVVNSMTTTSNPVGSILSGLI